MALCPESDEGQESQPPSRAREGLESVLVRLKDLFPGEGRGPAAPAVQLGPGLRRETIQTEQDRLYFQTPAFARGPGKEGCELSFDKKNTKRTK
jgi:hypothetical protein